MEGFQKKGEAKGRFPTTYHLTQLEICAATNFCSKVFQKLTCLDWVMSLSLFDSDVFIFPALFTPNDKVQGKNQEKRGNLNFLRISVSPLFGFLFCFVFLIHWRNQQKMLTKKESLFIILIWKERQEEGVPFFKCKPLLNTGLIFQRCKVPSWKPGEFSAKWKVCL